MSVLFIYLISRLQFVDNFDCVCYHIIKGEMSLWRKRLIRFIQTLFNIRLSPTEDFDGDNCWNNRREAVIRMLNESKPDLFGIQEGYVVQVN